MITMEKDLRGFFENRIFARGEDYFHSGCVDDLTIETLSDGSICANAIVHGSEEYETALWFDQKQRLFTNFECSCPYDDLCKHAAALGLAFIEKYEKKLPRDTEITAEDILATVGSVRTPEEIDAVIEKLQALKRAQTFEIKRHEPILTKVREATWRNIPPKVPNSPPPFTIKDYFIAFSTWGGKFSLRRKDTPYEFASVDSVLKHAERLTESQNRLMTLLKITQGAREDSSPVDLGALFTLIKESGIALREEYGYNAKNFTIDLNPEKFSATLRFEETHNEYTSQDIKRFVFELPYTSSDFSKNKFLESEQHLVCILGNTIKLHPMPLGIARIIIRARFPADDYYWNKPTAKTSMVQTKLTQEETTRVNEIIINAYKYLNLTTALTPDYELEKFNDAKKTLSVDFRSEEETLSIRPVIDYGFHREDVSESVFVSRASGKISFKRRTNYYAPDTHIIKFDGKKIQHALIQEKTEAELFESLYDQNLGLAKTPRQSVKGFRKILDFYETYWPNLKKKCGEIGCEIRFTNDTFDFAREDFRADFSIDANAENDWLAFDVACYCGPDKITLADLRRFIDDGREFIRRSDGRLLKITNHEELERFVAMLESFKERENGRFEGKLYHASELEYVATSSKHYNAVRGKGFEKFMENAKTGKPVKPVKLRAELRALLRPYQRAGIEWLYFLRAYGFAGILADDMGLGKTLQTLVLLEKERVAKKPSLVVCPKTLLYNWQSEALRFTPSMKVAVVDGTQSERALIIENAANYDLLITGYATLKKDNERYKKKKIIFNYCVLDEAQFIKNHATKNAQIAKEVDADYRLALTGTPLENSVSEIWSIFDFLMPGFLGSYKTFAKRFHKPIMERGDTKSLEMLRRKISCFMLRRTKEEVLTELPPKIEQTSHCHLDTAQNILYQEILARVKKDIFNSVKERGFNKSSIHILAGLTKLRQVCNHPNLLLKEKDYSKHMSAKLDMFNELIEEARENKRKVLVFSQFTEMLDILGKELKKRAVPYSYLSGKTNNRQDVVDTFNNDPTIPIFLISLKAGGTGLNLASADTVIIFDPWWNPSVENQAIGRAHRIGQKKSVNVYRLITAGTIEEKIVALQNKKSHLFNSIVGESKDLFQKLTWDDIQKLFQ